MLLYDPKIVLHYGTNVFMSVLPGPVQMGPVNGLQMAVAERQKITAIFNKERQLMS